MYSRWSNVAVFLFWLTAMSWLVHQKVLPSLLVGDPPNYRTIIDAQPEEPVAVGWTLRLDGKPLGETASITEPRTDEVTQIISHTLLHRVPLDQIAPALHGSAMAIFGRSAPGGMTFSFEGHTTIEIDPLGRPSAFRATAIVGPPIEANDDRPRESYLTISMTGVIEGRSLKLRIMSGQIAYSTSLNLPDDALLGDMLSPQAELPGLRIGQRWTFPTYNPLRSPNNAVEMIEAHVDHRESLLWGGQTIPTLVVFFRNVPGVELTSSQEVRGRMWVDPSGRVLKQELALMGSRLTFTRMATPPERPPDQLEKTY